MEASMILTEVAFAKAEVAILREKKNKKLQKISWNSQVKLMTVLLLSSTKRSKKNTETILEGHEHIWRIQNTLSNACSNHSISFQQGDMLLNSYVFNKYKFRHVFFSQ